MWKFLRETYSNFNRNLILKHLYLLLGRLRNIFDVLESRQACLQKYLSILIPELILRNDLLLWNYLLCNLLALLTCMLKIYELYLIHKQSCNSLVQLYVCYLESLQLLATSFLFLSDSLLCILLNVLLKLLLQRQLDRCWEWVMELLINNF